MGLYTLEDFARAAVRQKLKSDRSVGWRLAVIRGIESLGVTDRVSVARVKEEVLAVIDKRRRDVKESARAYVKRDPLGTQPQTAAERAATEYFSCWPRQVREAKKLGIDLETDYRHLEWHVWAYCKSLNSPELTAEPLDLFEVTAIVRSRNAQKAGLARTKNAHKKKQLLHPSVKGKIAANKLRKAQQSLF